MGDLEDFKKAFRSELEGVQSIEELKDLFASEVAKRDKIISELQEQNKLLLQSAFREKKSQLELEKE